MNTPLYIAKRYIFSKKSHSAINIISFISVFGIFVSTTSMVIVLSAFNGIESLVQNLFSTFDPPIKITLKEGKTFEERSVDVDKLLQVEGVSSVAKVIEEIVMVKHGEQWVTATLKGVDSNFFSVCNIESVITEGGVELKGEEGEKTIIGLGVQNRLQVTSNPRYSNVVTVYGLLRGEKLSRNNKKAFKPLMTTVGGVFSINPEFDNQYIITSLSFAKELLDYGNFITALEVGIEEGSNVQKVKENIQALLGEQFEVKTRYEQNEIVFKTNQTEKWMVFLILGFILVLSTFNIVASISMLLFDKQKDIRTLISLGATQKFIQRIFFMEGVFINLLGGISGLILGGIIASLQVKYKFIKLQNSVIDYWPVEIHWQDIVLIFTTVLIVGLISSYLPVRYLIRKQFSNSF